MLVLSSLGCQLFELFGLFNIDDCSEFHSIGSSSNQSINQSANQELSSFVWLKLLFVPTLGLLILTLFVLEDHCFGYENEQKHRSNHQSANQSISFNHQLNHQITNQSNNHVHVHRSRLGSSSGDAAKQCSCSHPSHTNQSSSSHHSSINQSMPGINGHMTYANGPSTSLHRSINHANNQSPHVILIVDSHPEYESIGQSYNQSINQSISQSIKATAYTFPLSFTLKDLISAHSQRHNQLLDPIKIWVDGRPINTSSINQSMEQLNVVDGSIIRVETDWKRIIDCMQIEDDRSINQLKATIQSTRKVRIEQQQIEKSLSQPSNQSVNQSVNQAITQSHVQSLEEAKALSAFQEMEVRHQSVKRTVDRLVDALQAAQKQYAECEEQKLNSPQSIEQSLNDQMIKTLESRITELKSLINQSINQMSELTSKQAKLDEEIVDLESKSEAQSVKLNRLIAEKEVWHKKIVDDDTNQPINQRLLAVEKAREKFARVKHQLDESERELEEKRTLKNDLNRSINQSILNCEREIAKTSAAVAVLETEHSSLQSVKQSVKQSEVQLKENQRMKQSINQSKVREKMLEKDLKELINWRQRAKAFEREVKSLRAWRRECARRERERGEQNVSQSFNQSLEQSINQLTSQLNLNNPALNLSQLSSQLSSSLNNPSINQLGVQLSNQLAQHSAQLSLHSTSDLDDYLDDGTYDDYNSLRPSRNQSINPSISQWSPSHSDSEDAVFPSFDASEAANQSTPLSDFDFERLSALSANLSNTLASAQSINQSINLSSTLQSTAMPFIPGVTRPMNHSDQSSPRGSGFW